MNQIIDRLIEILCREDEKDVSEFNLDKISYEKKKNIISGYVKETSFKNCSVLADSVDVEFSMNKMEKLKLSKLLREKMAKLKDN